MNVKSLLLVACIGVVTACKDRPGMGADTGVDTVNRKQEGRDRGDSAVAFAGKLDSMGVLFLQKEWLALKSDSALAATAVHHAKGKDAQMLAQNMLQMYPERRRQIEGIAYQLNVPLQEQLSNVDKQAVNAGSDVDASFIQTVKSRLQLADTRYQSAMKNDNNLLKDFAGRLRNNAQQELDALQAAQKK